MTTYIILSIVRFVRTRNEKDQEEIDALKDAIEEYELDNGKGDLLAQEKMERDLRI